MARNAERERAMEQVIGRSMLIGVLVVGAIVFGGGVVYLFAHGGERVAYGTFAPTNRGLESIRGTLGELAGGSRRAIVQLGLFLLVYLQLLRVLLAGTLFARERAWAYVAMTGFVLAVLLYGVLA